jgi:hypothetical protein
MANGFCTILARAGTVIPLRMVKSTDEKQINRLVRLVSPIG